MNDTTVAELIVSAVASGIAVVAWRRRAYPYAAAAAVVALVVATQVTWVLPCLMVLVGAWVVFTRSTRTASIVSRWGRVSRRKHGVASTFDVVRYASGSAMHRRAGVVRPSLAAAGRWTQRCWWSGLWARWTVPTHEIAVLMCRVGVHRVWALVEHVTVVFGGPRRGKTGWLAGRIIDAPGAVLATSTRTDLYAITGALRGGGGRPVYVFNAAGLGEVPSTIAFDPLTGCADPTAALERATDLLGAGTGSGSSERDHWVSQARRVLGALLHAAALGGLSMPTVLEWVSDTDAAYREITTLLRRSPMPSYVSDVKQFLGTNERTRTSITATMMPAMAWLASPAAVAATTGATPFDVAGLLADRGTVYLLGAEEAHTAPLLAALTGFIAREARRIAAGDSALACKGRLDPPLTLALDEVALICRVPLDDWTADMGGRGVNIIALFQSRTDMVNKWGEHGAGRILNNAGTAMLFGGTKDERDLRHWQALAGEHDEPVETTDPAGNVTSRSVRKVPTFTLSQLANLPPFRVLVFAPGMSVVVGWVKPAWKRADVKATLRTKSRVTDDTVADVVAEAQRAGEAEVWSVDAGGLTQRVGGHPDDTPALAPAPDPRVSVNGQVGGHPGGVSDGTG